MMNKVIVFMLLTQFSINWCFAKQDEVLSEVNHVEVLQKLAEGIELLGQQYTQLSEFEPEKHFNVEQLSISYAYHTHQAELTGGWTAGVPNPDDDGIWFYIDFHAPDSSAEIHNQPRKIKRHGLGGKRFEFLVLQGKKTKSVEAQLWQLFKSVGITEIDD